MNEEALQDLLREFIEALNTAGLSWLTAEIADLVTESNEILMLGPEPRHWRDGGFRDRTAQLEYTPREHLLLLLDAVERVIRNNLDAEREISGFFRAERHQYERSIEQSTHEDSERLDTANPTTTRVNPPNTLRFFSESVPGREPGGFELTTEDALEARIEAVKALTLAIRSIREEVSE